MHVLLSMWPKVAAKEKHTLSQCQSFDCSQIFKIAFSKILVCFLYPILFFSMMVYLGQ